MTHLRDKLRVFNQQIRWERWPGAAAHVEHAARADWVKQRRAAAKGLKVHEIQVTEVISSGPRATDAKVLLRITWYTVADMKVRTTNWVQNWTHGRQGWKLKGEERAPGETGAGFSWP